MDKKTEALKLALEALEGIHPGNMTPMAEEYWNKAITALSRALEQPAYRAVKTWHDRKPVYVAEQSARQPVAQCWKCGDMDAAAAEKCTVPWCGMREQPAQDGRDWSLLEATQESLREHAAEIKRLRALLAEQPAQDEPVEWLTGCPECGMDSCDCDSGTWNPQAREWVGLTDAQIGAVAADIWGSVLIAPQSYQAFARAIEAKLKEKNT